MSAQSLPIPMQYSPKNGVTSACLHNFCSISAAPNDQKSESAAVLLKHQMHAKGACRFHLRKTGKGVNAFQCFPTCPTRKVELLTYLSIQWLIGCVFILTTVLHAHVDR